MSLIGMNHPYFKNLKDKTVVIVTQQGTTGPSHDVRDLLVPEVKQLLFIGHPLLYLPENFKKNSQWELYRKGKKVSGGDAGRWRGPELFLYLKDFFYSIFWFFRGVRRSDIFIGVGNINALVGVLLQKLGFVTNTVFYCIDYVPVRFANSFVNAIYHRIDSFVAEHATVVWNLSPRMIEGREKKWGRRLGNQIVVPIGIWYGRIHQNLSEKVNNNEIIYLGTLLEKQGLDLCIDAVNELRKNISNIRLTVIGSGPYGDALKSKVRSLGLEKHVVFEGYMPSHADVEKRVSEAALALAMYNKEKDTFSYYADPGKVKVYLACGVPVLITDIPFIARQVEREECGFVIEYDKDRIVKVVKKFLEHPDKVKMYKTNAMRFAKKFDWPLVVRDAFEKSSFRL